AGRVLEAKELSQTQSAERADAEEVATVEMVLNEGHHLISPFSPIMASAAREAQGRSTPLTPTLSPPSGGRGSKKIPRQASPPPAGAATGRTGARLKRFSRKGILPPFPSLRSRPRQPAKQRAVPPPPPQPPPPEGGGEGARRPTGRSPPLPASGGGRGRG